MKKSERSIFSHVYIYFYASFYCRKPGEKPAKGLPPHPCEEHWKRRKHHAWEAETQGTMAQKNNNTTIQTDCNAPSLQTQRSWEEWGKQPFSKLFPGIVLLSLITVDANNARNRQKAKVKFLFIHAIVTPPSRNCGF